MKRAKRLIGGGVKDRRAKLDGDVVKRRLVPPRLQNAEKTRLIGTLSDQTARPEPPQVVVAAPSA